MSVSNNFGSFCWNRNVRLKFPNQNGRQFRLHCVTGPVDTAEITRTYMYDRPESRREFGGAASIPSTCLAKGILGVLNNPKCH